MNKLSGILHKIPDEGLLVFGEVGEFWTDRARFSSGQALVAPPVYQTEAISGYLGERVGGGCKGLFLAWGLSRLSGQRKVAEKLLTALEDAGGFFAVEAIGGELPPAERNHYRFLELITGGSPLPKNRLLALLKTLGLTQARAVEFHRFGETLGEKELKAFRDWIETRLGSISSAEAERLLTDIRAEGLAPSPFLLIHAQKRGSRQSAVPVKSSVKLNIDSLQRKILDDGAAALGEEELLSAALGCDTETSRRILQQYGGKALLREKHSRNFAEEAGIDELQAAHLLALLELGKRFYSPAAVEALELHSPSEAAEYLEDMRLLKREHLRCLYLDLRGRLIWDEVVAIGTLSKALVSPREIIGPALEHSATGIIIAHNHLSDIAEPSPEDREMTALVENAAEMMNLDLWDHIIITKEGYYSFNEAGEIKASSRGFRRKAGGNAK